MKYLGLLFSTFCLFGCWQQGSGSYKVYVDPNFTADRQAIVKQGVSKWEDSINGFVTFEYTTNWKQDSNLITISPSSVQALTNQYGSLDDARVNDIDVVGETRFEGTSSLILLAIDETPIWFLQCTEHEMGHALGLGHTDPGEVMFHSQDGAAMEVTCEDVIQFCGIWDCNPYELPACQL